jgi:hypothetical protein
VAALASADVDLGVTSPAGTGVGAAVLPTPTDTLAPTPPVVITVAGVLGVGINGAAVTGGGVSSDVVEAPSMPVRSLGCASAADAGNAQHCWAGSVTQSTQRALTRCLRAPVRWRTAAQCTRRCTSWWSQTPCRLVTCKMRHRHTAHTRVIMTRTCTQGCHLIRSTSLAARRCARYARTANCVGGAARAARKRRKAATVAHLTSRRVRRVGSTCAQQPR